MSVLKAAVGLGIAGGAVAAYSMWEARQYGLLDQTIPLLPPGSEPLRILHLSDLHLTSRQDHKIAWLDGLPSIVDPDLTVVTGDFLADPQAVPIVLEALAGVLSQPGAFVLGSNDYFAPRIVNPFSYLLAPSELQRTRPEMPWGDLVAGLREAGWSDLDNASIELPLGREQIPVALRGVDDPHIGLDRYEDVAGPFPADAQVRIGVAHAPYLRVLDAMAEDGADLILAGHTHGGQVCLPGGRALVTNCDLDPAHAAGLSRHGDALLHVSQGLGTAPSAPFRLFCPPRATLITLVAADAALG
jgi:predicted MPP superfamily phosphohydrolase